jgi:hypothetical protein
MSKTIQRPIIEIERVFVEKRSALEAFATVLVREMERRQSIRTFDPLKEPHYNISESEVLRNDTTA